MGKLAWRKSSNKRKLGIHEENDEMATWKYQKQCNPPSDL
jgi:hypothetical protein